MKLSELSKDDLKKVMAEVEAALAKRRTKASVLATLAELGYCSAKSTGIEKTLLKICERNNNIPPIFASVMGVAPVVEGGTHQWVDRLPAVPQNQATKSAGLADQKPVRRLETPAVVGLNIRSVSMVVFKKASTNILLHDGSEITGSELSEAELKNHCTLLELKP